MTDRERLMEIKERQWLAQRYKEQREGLSLNEEANDILVALGILAGAGFIGGLVILMIMWRWM